jgi:hypothetical protein
MPQILQHLLTVKNRCVILATCAPHQLLQCADYIVVLAAGRVQQTATYTQLCSTAIGRAALDSYTRPLQCNGSSSSSSSSSVHSSAVQHRHNNSSSTSSNNHSSMSSGNGGLRVTQSAGHVAKGVVAPSNGTATFAGTHSNGSSINRVCCCCCSTAATSAIAANTARCSWNDSIGGTHRAVQIVAILSIAQLCDVVATWYNFNSTFKLLALITLQLVLTVVWELVLRLCTLYEAAVVHARNTRSSSSSSSSCSIGISTDHQQQHDFNSETDSIVAAVTAAECIAVVLCERTRLVLLVAAVVYATPLMLLVLVPTVAVFARWYWMHSTLAEHLALMQAATAPELQLHAAEVIEVSTLYNLLIYYNCSSEFLLLL